MEIKKNNPLDIIEIQELVDKLRQNGHGELVDCLLDNENKVYTKKGRLNKSSACRELGWKNKQLEDALLEMRELLEEDLPDS